MFISANTSIASRSNTTSACLNEVNLAMSKELHFAGRLNSYNVINLDV